MCLDIMRLQNETIRVAEGSSVEVRCGHLLANYDLVKDGMNGYDWVENQTLNVPFVNNDSHRISRENRVQIWSMRRVHSGRYSCISPFNGKEKSSAFIVADKGKFGSNITLWPSKIKVTRCSIETKLKVSLASNLN